MKAELCSISMNPQVSFRTHCRLHRSNMALKIVSFAISSRKFLLKCVSYGISALYTVVLVAMVFTTASKPQPI